MFDLLCHIKSIVDEAVVVYEKYLDSVSTICFRLIYLITYNLFI